MAASWWNKKVLYLRDMDSLGVSHLEFLKISMTFKDTSHISYRLLLVIQEAKNNPANTHTMPAPLCLLFTPQSVLCVDWRGADFLNDTAVFENMNICGHPAQHCGDREFRVLRFDSAFHS